MPYVGLEHIEPQTMRLLGNESVRDIRSSSVQFSKGDVLYGKMRPYLNKVWVASFDGLCSAEFLVFPKRDGVNSLFFAMRLNSEDFVTFANERVSGERPRVHFEKLAHFPILLPPTTEQERIVTKLRAALSAMDRAEKAAKRAIERLERYRITLLGAAVSGDLTRAWREARSKDAQAGIETGRARLQRLVALRRSEWEKLELDSFRSQGKTPKNEKWRSRYVEPEPPGTSDLPEIPPSWVWARLQQLGFVGGGLTKSPRRTRLPLKLPYLRVANVYANELRLDKIESIGVAERELDKLLLEKGDLLIVEGNGSKDQIGRVAIWDGSIKRCVHQNHIIKVRLVETHLSPWILSWLLSRPGRQLIERVASSTTGLYTLSINKVADLPIPVPSVGEQTEILSELEHRLNAANRLRTTLIQQLARARTTRQSLMSKAFAGQLVPQDPNDEPASALLDRLRASSKVKPYRPKGKRMPKSESKTKTGRRPLLAVLQTNGRPMTPEELFQASGHSQESVDEFFAELRQLTTPPTKILEERKTGKRTLLRAVS